MSQFETVLRKGDGGRLRSAVELRDLMGRGKLSAAEVMSATLERIEAINDELNAYVTLSPSALDEARALDRNGSRKNDPLFGLPVIVKDVTETAGLRTTWGSPTYAEHVPEEDALVVARLRAAGAIVVGKGNTPEMALGGHTDNPVFGPTGNPWDKKLSPGGSTGGGAVALATGMAALSEGTDLGGSLRIPTSFCGLAGIRPSVGLVPTVPSPHPWDTLQVTGPIARTADDLALFLDATAGWDPRAPLSWDPPVPSYLEAVRGVELRGVKVAYCPDPTRVGIDPRVEKVCREAAFALRDAGVIVEEIDLDLSMVRATFRRLRGLWALSWHQHRLGDEDGVGADEHLGVHVASNLELGVGLTSRELGAANQERKRLREQIGSLLEDYGAVLTPTMAVPPFLAADGHPTSIAGRPMETYIDWLAPTSVLSLTGLPVMSVPAGLDGPVDEGGMPVGLQVMGRPRDEVFTLAVGRRVAELRPIPEPKLPAR